MITCSIKIMCFQYDDCAVYVFLFTVLLALLSIYQILTQLYQNGKGQEVKAGLELIPGPTPFPISYIGNLYHFKPIQETLKKTLAWHKLYGSCIKVSGAGLTCLLVFSAELAQTFLKSGEFGHVSKSKTIFYDVMRPLLGNGLLISEGNMWQIRRKALMQTMTFQSLKSYTGLLNKHSKRFVGSLEKLFASDDGDEQQQHQINIQINSSFLEIITEILTGSDIYGTKEGDDYHHHFQTWKQIVLKRLERPWLFINWIWNLHPISKEHDIAIESMYSFAKRRLAEHKLEKQKNPKENDDVKNVKVKNMLDVLLDEGVSDADILCELNTFLFGGHETTATTIHMFMFIMALHSQYQELCRKEIDKVFETPSQAPNGNLTFESLSNLKYVERCLLETLRLFPPVFTFSRSLKTSIKIEYDGKEVEVPAGTDVILSPWVIHRNTQYYHDPEKFDPDRFLPEECAKRHPYAFLPFSSGPRNCIGWKFGMNEMKIVAAHVLRNFHVSTTDKLDDIPLLPNVILTPERDYNFILKRRLV